MRRLHGLWVLTAIALCACPAGGQERPDFSGRWTAGSAPPPAGSRGASTGTMGSGWAADIIIDQDADWLTVECLIFSSGDLQPPLQYRYALDGSSHVNKILMGYGIQEFPSRASWVGDKLVISTTYQLVDPQTGRNVSTRTTQTLSLRSSPLVLPPSLVVEWTIEGVLGGPSSTTRTVYTRL